MKHRNLILIISILIFASCKEITKNDINGNWIAVPSGYDEPTFWEINFKEDKVELIGDNLFKEVGSYQVENGEIRIQLNRDDLRMETKIQNLENDTLLIFDSLTYHRNREITNSNFEEYELIGIPTNRFLSTERKLFHLIHFYKSKDDEVRIRLGDKLTNYDDVPLFLAGGHSQPQVLIFVGEGINLKDLKNLYYRLISSGQSQVWLGTKKEGLTDTHIFKDKIEIWWEDLENHLAKLTKPQPPPPPPPIDFTSKENYLIKIGEEVKILNRDDFQKIEELENNKRYVVSISTDLIIEDYLELKKMVAEKKKINSQIITEIE
jgi:hypothetical protein